MVITITKFIAGPLLVLVERLGSWATLSLLMITFLNLGVLLLGTVLVLPRVEGHAVLFVITPLLVPLLDLTGLAFSLWYVALVIVIFLSVWWTVHTSRDTLRRELLPRWTVLDHSPAFLVGTLWFALLALNMAFYLLIGQIASPSTPTYDDRPLWTTIFSLAHASVWEELVSRTLLIGVPLLVIDTIHRRRAVLHRYLLGGHRRIGSLEACLMLFSATMFGLAHVWAWDLYKVLPAVVGGLMMAYLFLRLGLWASIAFHFLNNYLTMWTAFGVPDGLSSAFDALVLGWTVVGVLFLACYGAKVLAWLRSRHPHDYLLGNYIYL